MAERKIWFVTRPERDPKFHRDALLALSEATNNFQIKWNGNRTAHLAYEKILSSHGVKRENISNDGSGGRTWAALLKTFSYVYVNDDGFLVPTKSALKIIAGEKVRENVTKQILTLQIPNAYFLDKGFRPKYEADFKIRPARFLVKLVNQASLEYYLTKEEITFFVLTAKSDNQISDITQKIISYRNADENTKSRMRIEIADEFDHRERSDKGARDFQGAHGDVAHTFMLICEYTELVEYIRGDSILRVLETMRANTSATIDMFDKRYPYNTRYLISIQRMAENNGLDVDSYKASTFYGDSKQAANKDKTARKVQAILASIPSAASLSEDELRKLFLNEFSSKETEKIIGEIKKYEYQALNSEFVEEYLNESDNLKFEDKTGEILKLIGFDITMRPKSNILASTEIEILAKINENSFGIIDAKNYRQKFSLPANLVSHMASEYIPNYDGYKDSKLVFFGYVTATDIGGVKNLQKISDLVKRSIPDREIKGFMINSATLIGFLDYCLENNISTEQRMELFLKAIDNSAYTTLSQILGKVLNNG